MLFPSCVIQWTQTKSANKRSRVIELSLADCGCSPCSIHFNLTCKTACLKRLNWRLYYKTVCLAVSGSLLSKIWLFNLQVIVQCICIYTLKSLFRLKLWLYCYYSVFKCCHTSLYIYDRWLCGKAVLYCAWMKKLRKKTMHVRRKEVCKAFGPCENM